MKLKLILISLFLLIGITLNAQDFTLSRNTSANLGTLGYSGSLVISGDSALIWPQGQYNLYIKDVVATADTIIVEDQTSVEADTVNYSIVEPNWIRLVVQDSLGVKKYSNYVDVSAYDPGNIVIVTYVEELVANTTHTVYFYVYGLKWKGYYLPGTPFINSR